MVLEEGMQPILVSLPGESHGQEAWQAKVHRVAQSWTWLQWSIMQEEVNDKFRFPAETQSFEESSKLSLCPLKTLFARSSKSSFV